MITITPDMLLKISPSANHDIVNGLVGPLNKYLPQYGIDTCLRLDHFFGQCAEESAGFRTLVEYASGNEYEGRADLGNVNEGDGPRYKGRGMIQLTGCANYRSEGQTLGIDLEGNPDLAATPDVAVQVACLYWKTHNLNAYADQDDINSITRRINGGLNGLADRQTYTDRADDTFSAFFP